MVSNAARFDIENLHVYSTMRSLHGVGSILRSKGRAKLLIAATAWPGARLGSRFQSESSTTPNERLSRLMTLASPILWRRSSCGVGELGYFIYSLSILSQEFRSELSAN